MAVSWAVVEVAEGVPPAPAVRPAVVLTAWAAAVTVADSAEPPPPDGLAVARAAVAKAALISVYREAAATSQATW